jgi:hypothetical protein
MMCFKQVPYWAKWLFALVMTILGGFVMVSSLYGLGSGGDADVKLDGDDDHAVIQQSSGIHLLELNNSGDDDCGGGMSWSVIALITVSLILVVKFTHIVHYCFVSKVLIKSKVEKQVAIRMNDLLVEPTAPPVDDADNVPGI